MEQIAKLLVKIVHNFSRPKKRILLNVKRSKNIFSKNNYCKNTCFKAGATFYNPFLRDIRENSRDPATLLDLEEHLP